MSRRRRSVGAMCAMGGTDPGKDLFAYLFLMIMVFCFMLLMTANEVTQKANGQSSPEKQDAAGSSVANVAVDNIGRLVKEKNELFLQFGNERYHPERDLGRLEADGCLVILADEETGEEKKRIYIEESKTQQVLLTEYLSAFQFLSRKGIGVAFAERIDE